MESTFCRLCAEPKPLKKLLLLQKHQAKYVEVCRKLEFLQATFVNMSDDSFPIAICSVCYDSLNQAFQFLERVKKAQGLLTNKLAKRKSNSSISSDLSARDETEDSSGSIIIKSEPMEVPVDIEYFTESLNSSSGHKKKPCKTIVDIAQPVRTDLHWTNIPWLCYFCDSQFSTINDLRTHAKTQHNTCGAFKCSYCNLKIPKNNFRNFIRHLKKHVKCLRHWCHYCNEPFASFFKLVAHVSKHIEGRSQCHYCGETFDDENGLQEHLVKYSARQDNPKPRRKPGEPEDIADRTCKICNKILLNASSIPAHMQHMHADRQPKYTCELCGKTFYWKESVTAHVQTVHEKSRSFQCRICDKTFTQRSNLKMHVRALHSGEKLYECDVCGKKCSRNTQLTEHKKTHSDELPFNCDICHKAFRKKTYLKNHQRQHTGEKPHACEFCGKTFTCTGNRNKHLLRIHNKDTPKRAKPSQYIPNAELEEWKQEVTKRIFTRDVAVITQSDESTVSEFTGQCW